MSEQLAKYKFDVGVYDVYTIIKTGDRMTKLFLAAYDADETFLEDYIYSDDIDQAFKGKITISEVPYTDKFGTFYSGYAPLYNDENQIVAVVAVDMNVDSINALKQNMFKKAASIFFICFVIGNIIVYLFAKSLGKSFKNMINGLKRIGEGELFIESRSKMPMFTEMTDLEKTINEMASKISSLIEIVAESARELDLKTEHILDMIVTTDTSSQIMASTIEQMSNVNGSISIDFEKNLEQLFLYKEDSEMSVITYKSILESVQSTKDTLESILVFLHKMGNEPVQDSSITEFEQACHVLYLQYDAFAETFNRQMGSLDHITVRREELIDINQKIASDLKLIANGNQRVVESMDQQVSAIQDAVKDVEMLKAMAKDLNAKISILKTKG